MQPQRQAMPGEPPFLYTPRLILRLPEPSEAGDVLRHYTENSGHFAPTSPIPPPGADTVTHWRARLEHDLQQFRDGIAVRYFLFPRDAPSHVLGNISLSNIVRGAAQYCDLGYNLAFGAQGHGLMTEAGREVIRYAFTELGLHRISAAYLPHNRRSERLLERLGFTVEGYARALLIIQGEWQDHVRASLINDNWSPSMNVEPPVQAKSS